MFSKYLSVFIISMVPLIELRGAIPIAITMGLDPVPAIATCAVGNLLPMPVIYFFAHKVLMWGLDKPYIGRICRFFHNKGKAVGARLTASKFGKYGLILALIAFVGIPWPGTGAWTGTLGARFLGMSPRATAIAVTLGVALAAILMTSISLVGVHAFGI